MNTKHFMIALLAVAATPALADDRQKTDPWGTVEQAHACTVKDVNWSATSITYTLEHNKEMSDACKTETRERIAACTADPKQKPIFDKKKDDYPKGFDDYCAQTAFTRIQRQVTVKDDVELPKPGKKDAALEKLIGAAYAKAYPDNKVLKVIIVSDDWSTERNDYGTVIGRNIQAFVANQQEGNYCQLHSEAWYQEYIGGKFSGPITQRGAGSQQLTGILCSKAGVK